MRLLLPALLSLTPCLAMAGANPLSGAGAPPPANQKYENVFRKEREIANCERAGGVMGTDGVCRQPEPVVLPRDGVTDELLEKYRIKK